LDDDAYWLPGTIERLIRDLEANPHLALVSAWHGARSPEPLVNGFRSIDAYRHERLPRPDAPLGSAPLVVDCAFVGMHVAVHRTELLERLGSNPFTVAADDTAGEDVAFCKRIAEQGGTIAMDCTIAVWHVGIGSVNSEEQALAFVPYIPPCRIVNGVPQPMAGEAKRVVDRRFYGERVTRAIIAGFA
jgi:GT2 family glycosyltransferase